MEAVEIIDRTVWRGEDEDARCLGGYISTISRVGGWKSPPRHSARKIVSGLTIHSHVPLPPSPLSASSVSRVFTRWIPVNIWHVRDAVDTSSSMHMRIVFFFPSLSLSLPPFFSFHTIALHDATRGGNFNAIDRSVADTFAPDWFDSRRIFESCWMCGCIVRDIDTRDYFGETLEDYYHLWDKAFNGINRGRRKYWNWVRTALDR